MNSTRAQYQQLIESFLHKEISTLEFESAYLERFKNEPEGMPKLLFEALNRLFFEIDRFCEDDDLRDEDDLDEDGLRQACEVTLAEIAEL